MLYITTEKTLVSGSYSEPIDDGCPSMGTYSFEKTIIIPQDTGIELDEKGTVKDIDMEINCGVSMYQGTFTPHDNLKALIGTKLKPIAVKDYNIILERKEKETEFRERIWKATEEKDFIDCEYEYLQEKIDAIHASGSFSKEKYEELSRQLMSNAVLYVKNIAALAKLNMTVL